MLSDNQGSRPTRDVVAEFKDPLNFPSMAEKLKAQWGGRFPTWDEYKKACQHGGVRANKSIGINAIWLKAVPTGHKVMFGIVTPSAVFIVPVVCVVLSIIGMIGWWSVIVGLFASWYLYKVTLEGAADAIKYGAIQSEPLYQALVCRGAFLLDPPPNVAV